MSPRYVVVDMDSHSTSSAISKPVPVPDEFSEAYWSAAANGQLAIQHCSHCGRYSHPPTPVCSGCFTVPPAFTFEPVSGRGAILTWTVMRQTFLPGFASDVPYVIAVAQLAEQPGLTLIGRLTDGPDAPLTIGARVRVVFEEPVPGVAVPAFRLDGEPL